MYRAIIITNNINDTDVLCNILIGVSETIDFINNGAFLIKTKITIDEINNMLLNYNINSLFIVIDLDKIIDGGVVYHKEQYETLDLNKILDKINKTGYESLTKKEKIYLENYGK